ncbi:hypothetical protein F5884DRAFT_686022, partial [Xylogone sp. PMI_703]
EMLRQKVPHRKVRTGCAQCKKRHIKVRPYAYQLLAAHHQNRALPLIRTAITCINEENCHALYACGHLVLNYAFATPDSKLVFSDELGVVSEWVTLVRGSFTVSEFAMNWLSNGPFSSSLEKPVVLKADLSLNPEDFRFAPLVSLLKMNDGEDMEHCREALDILRKLSAMAISPNPPVTVKTIVYTWPYKISRRYIELVSQRIPEALLVLAHYCLLMKKIEDFWYMKGCAARILHQCQKDLSPEWWSLLDWPVSVISTKESNDMSSIESTP